MNKTTKEDLTTVSFLILIVALLLIVQGVIEKRNVNKIGRSQIVNGEYRTASTDFQYVKFESFKILEEIKDEVSSYEYEIPENSGFKSYMSYKAITSKSSYQYKIQEVAYTSNYGIRQVDGRYCIAVGTGLNAPVGTYIDLILDNETVIECIVGDIKADIHTLNNNIVTKSNGCVSEFIVDEKELQPLAKKMGNMSYCEDAWKSKVVKVKVYDKNVLN